jgi:hypothetical protein
VVVDGVGQVKVITGRSVLERLKSHQGKMDLFVVVLIVSGTGVVENNVLESIALRTGI